jgi:hypothetical protein
MNPSNSQENETPNQLIESLFDHEQPQTHAGKFLQSIRLYTFKN